MGIKQASYNKSPPFCFYLFFVIVVSVLLSLFCLKKTLYVEK